MPACVVQPALTRRYQRPARRLGNRSRPACRSALPAACDVSRLVRPLTPQDRPFSADLHVALPAFPAPRHVGHGVPVARRLHRPGRRDRCDRHRHRHQRELVDRQAHPRQVGRGRPGAVLLPQQRRAGAGAQLPAVPAGPDEGGRPGGLTQAADVSAGDGGARPAAVARAARADRQGRHARGVRTGAAGGVGPGERLPRLQRRHAPGARVAAVARAGRCAGDPSRRGAHAQLPQRARGRLRPGDRALGGARPDAGRPLGLQPAVGVAPRPAEHAAVGAARGGRTQRAHGAGPLRRQAAPRLRRGVSQRQLSGARLVAGARSRAGQPRAAAAGQSSAVGAAGQDAGQRLARSAEPAADDGGVSAGARRQPGLPVAAAARHDGAAAGAPDEQPAGASARARAAALAHRDAAACPVRPSR